MVTPGTVKRALPYLIAALVIWFGAFLASALGVEWRQHDSRGLRTEIVRLREQIAAFMPSETPAEPTPGSSTPTPTEVVLPAQVGQRADIEGFSLEVTSVYPQRNGGTITFIIANVDAGPDAYPSFDVLALGKDSYVCSNAGGGSKSLQPGQKTEFWISWQCESHKAESLRIGHVIFRF